MAQLTLYLPIFLLMFATMALLLVTDARRRRHWNKLIACFAGLRGGHRSVTRSKGGGKSGAWRRFQLRRMLFWSLALFVLSYGWTYQRAQHAIAVELAANGMQEIHIGSLIIPYSAFFQAAYLADAGFSHSRKRTRTEVSLSGHPWGGYLGDHLGGKMVARIDQPGLTRINSLLGKKFVFSYLTDVETLRPAIDQHMRQLIRGKQIEHYEIETFDNRGPYLIVLLNQQDRRQDAHQAATALATDLYTTLTKTNQLQVNQVVVKVVEPQPYLANKTIQVIARGTAGVN